MIESERSIYDHIIYDSEVERDFATKFENNKKSEVKKRQEIGRGMRLSVDQNGERVFGFDVNTLTVMAPSL